MTWMEVLQAAMPGITFTCGFYAARRSATTSETWTIRQLRRDVAWYRRLFELVVRERDAIKVAGMIGPEAVREQVLRWRGVYKKDPPQRMGGDDPCAHS